MSAAARPGLRVVATCVFTVLLARLLLQVGIASTPSQSALRIAFAESLELALSVLVVLAIAQRRDTLRVAP